MSFYSSQAIQKAAKNIPNFKNFDPFSKDC